MKITRKELNEMITKKINEVKDAIDRKDTDNYNIWRKQKTFDHYLIVIRKKSNNELIFAGKVNWMKFRMLINGQVSKGVMKLNKSSHTELMKMIEDTK